MKIRILLQKAKAKWATIRLKRLKFVSIFLLFWFSFSKDVLRAYWGESKNLLKTKWMNRKKCKYNFIIIWPHCISKARSQEKKKKTRRRARRPQEGREVTLVIWPRGHLSSYTFGLIAMTIEGLDYWVIHKRLRYLGRWIPLFCCSLQTFLFMKSQIGVEIVDFEDK